MEIYESDAHKKYAEYIRMIRHHPIKYMKQLEDNFGTKFKLHQKISFMLSYIIPNKEQRKAMRIDKLLKAYNIKR